MGSGVDVLVGTGAELESHARFPVEVPSRNIDPNLTAARRDIPLGNRVRGKSALSAEADWIWDQIKVVAALPKLNN